MADPRSVKAQLSHVARPSSEILLSKKGTNTRRGSAMLAIKEAVTTDNIRSAATNTMRGVGEWLGVAGSAQTLENWRQVHERNAVGPGAQGGRLNNAYGEIILFDSRVLMQLYVINSLIE